MSTEHATVGPPHEPAFTKSLERVCATLTDRPDLKVVPTSRGDMVSLQLIQARGTSADQNAGRRLVAALGQNGLLCETRFALNTRWPDNEKTREATAQAFGEGDSLTVAPTEDAFAQSQYFMPYCIDSLRNTAAAWAQDTEGPRPGLPREEFVYMRAQSEYFRTLMDTADRKQANEVRAEILRTKNVLLPRDAERLIEMVKAGKGPSPTLMDSMVDKANTFRDLHSNPPPGFASVDIETTERKGHPARIAITGLQPVRPKPPTDAGQPTNLRPSASRRRTGPQL
ncbi:hypothetical protein ABZ234_08135 [Nocardiopsis sp. NPDC006198]|uniref:hypothetical protein n=1 Tax=Nocardiopsis sp. NPDC006198 TaxID=3154472 RepID=UPI0033A47FBE